MGRFTSGSIFRGGGLTASKSSFFGMVQFYADKTVTSLKTNAVEAYAFMSFI